ncbi:MAG TPA: STAS domain-containing protein [Chitinophagales bacterium]|nr:STAS domain-containing protein [Chitinophagales bacterium]
MDFTITQDDKVSVLTLKGSLLADVQTKEILEKVSALVQEGKVNFVVDMGQLKFINSSGLGMLLTCLLKARKNRGDLILANVPEQVSNLLNITKLNSVFSIVESVKEGKAKF